MIDEDGQAIARWSSRRCEENSGILSDYITRPWLPGSASAARRQYYEFS